MRSCCRSSKISTSLSWSDRAINVMRSNRIEQTCARSKKIMGRWVAGNMPSSEPGRDNTYAGYVVHPSWFLKRMYDVASTGHHHGDLFCERTVTHVPPAPRYQRSPSW